MFWGSCQTKSSAYKGCWRSVWSLCLYFWRNFSARAAASGISGWLAIALLTTWKEGKWTQSLRLNKHQGSVNAHNTDQLRVLLSCVQHTLTSCSSLFKVEKQNDEILKLITGCCVKGAWQQGRTHEPTGEPSESRLYADTNGVVSPSCGISCKHDVKAADK